jgi:glycosyltransferase involved in cell wall biosynthesis
MSAKILFIVPYPYGCAPSQRLKFEQYYSAFEKKGFVITHAPFMDKPMWNIVYKKGRIPIKILFTLKQYVKRIRLLFTIRQYDIIYLHLWGTPFGLPVYEWLVRKLAAKLVYDIDDLVFLKNIKHENKLLSLVKGKGKPFFLMKHADHVITCTPYLDAIAQKYNSNTTDISSTINTSTYIPVNNYSNDHELVIGWSGSHSTSQYLYLLKDVFLELQKIVSFKLLVMGDATFHITGLNIQAIAWKEEYEISTLQSIDIGVYPLPLEEEWVLGKSGLKALQYMALGIPAIATDVGCNNRVIENGVSGYLVKNKAEWLQKLKLLCENPSLRRTMGELAIIRVGEKFSVKNTSSVYCDIISNL